MSRNNNNYSHAVFAACTLLMALLIAASVVWSMARASTTEDTQDIVCWEMSSGFLVQEKWRRVPEASRQSISSRVARGLADIREETSFKCRQYRNGEIYREFLARGQWWKKRK